MKRLLALLLLLCLVPGLMLAEEQPPLDGVYDLSEQITLREGEELYLARETSYYSAAPVYKGTTSAELPGCCVLHSSAVVITNLLGETVTAQTLARANNKGYNTVNNWTSIVVWGRLARACDVDFARENLADYRQKLRARGNSGAERRDALLERIRQNLETHGDFIGLIAHFNSSGEVNGNGRMHAVTVMGYIKKDGKIVDLVVNDCNVPPPQGACVRMSESSLASSMIGEKKIKSMTEEEIVTALMDVIVSCRWVMRK